MDNKNLNETRHLATIQTIDNILEHTGADKLQIACVIGWRVVVQKEEFKIGDKIIYCEIDSILPQAEWSKGLESRNYRIKTIKLRGELSQGLILPMSILPPNNYNIGDDVTSLLNINKYETKEESSGCFSAPMKTSMYPSTLIKKTDEPRIQSNNKLLDMFYGKPYVATLKYDGCSCTFLLNPDDPQDLWICSRNQKLDNDEKTLYHTVANKYKIKDKLQEFPTLVIQGEIYGPKINKNLLNKKDLCFNVFSTYDLKEKRWHDMTEIKTICENVRLDMVEIVYTGDNFNFNIKELLKLAQGNYNGTKNPREGLVFRYTNKWFTDDHRYSFKIINNDYLLKEK